MLKSMVLPGLLLACRIAERSVTVPGGGLGVSAVLLTVMTAGASRSSAALALVHSGESQC
jgi:hypothetical protein